MRVRVLIAVAAIAAVTSCVHALDVGVGNLPGIGSFTLVQVDGTPLPYRGTTAVTVRGSLTIQTDSKYVLTQTDSALAGGAAPVTTYQGGWTLTAGTYALENAANTSFVALGVVSENGDTITATMNPSLHTNLYVKK